MHKELVSSLNIKLVFNINRQMEQQNIEHYSLNGYRILIVTDSENKLLKFHSSCDGGGGGRLSEKVV